MEMRRGSEMERESGMKKRVKSKKNKSESERKRVKGLSAHV